MTAAKRFLNVLYALVMLLGCFVMVMDPDDGYALVIMFLDITLLFYGLRLLVYYFTMARYMVGGIATFYKSIIAIDLGLFVFSLDQLPQKYAMLYLVSVLAFSGAVDILRSIESRRMRGPWKLHIIYGALKLGTAITCLFFLNSVRLVTILYCVGLLHSAALMLINAFRKTAIVYVGS